MNRTDCKNPGLGSVNPIVGGGGGGGRMNIWLRRQNLKLQEHLDWKKKNV
jgi:hypothetical protein